MTLSYADYLGKQIKNYPGLPHEVIFNRENWCIECRDWLTEHAKGNYVLLPLRHIPPDIRATPSNLYMLLVKTEEIAVEFKLRWG